MFIKCLSNAGKYRQRVLWIVEIVMKQKYFISVARIVLPMTQSLLMVGIRSTLWLQSYTTFETEYFTLMGVECDSFLVLFV